MQGCYHEFVNKSRRNMAGRKLDIEKYTADALQAVKLKFGAPHDTI
jgi:hypothetical protein